ncbi:AMP-binding protein [Persephonella sp.]
MIPIDNRARLIYNDKVVEFSRLARYISGCAEKIDISRGDRVCIFGYNRPEWVYSFFAVWSKEGIPVPIDFMSTVDEVSYILSDSSPSYIFVSADRLETAEKAVKAVKSKPKIILFEDCKEGKNTYSKPDLSPDDTAVILYTSGTTGSPKGVMLTYRNLLSNIKGLEATNIADSSDSTVAILPFHHSYPLMVSMLYPLYIGATIVFLPALTPEEILKTMQKHRITVLIGVPRLYQLFHRKIFGQINSNIFTKSVFKAVKKLNYQPAGKLIFKKVHRAFGGNIKYFVSGGAKLDEDTAKDLWALGFKIIEGYGLTETSPIVSFNPPDRIKLGSAGKPIKGVQVKIQDGEVLVKGENVMKGYWNKPDETAKVIKDGWLYTGDTGYLDSEGYLYITGRKKDIIVLPSGKNINPEEIESRILKISDLVKEAAVVYTDGKLTAIIYPDLEKAYQKGIVNLEETIKWNVIDRVNQTLPDYKKISGFKLVNKELPKTRLGKIRRFMLEEFLKEKEQPKKIKEPDFEEYRILKEYLEKTEGRQVLPDSHIEIDLGLDSLEKIELLTFISKTFGINITEHELVKHPTVEKLSLFIKEHRKKITPEEEINWKEILSEPYRVDISEVEKPLILLKRLLTPLFKAYFKLKVSGLENLPQTSFILASNHQSFLDGFLLITALPDKHLKKTYFLAEETYFPKGVIQEAGRLFHVIPVNINKDLKGSLITSASVLKEGKNLVIFPEGARTRDGSLLPFKKAFGILAHALNIPVVPVVIKGAFQAFPIGSKIPKPKKIEVKFLPPVDPQQDVSEIVKQTYESIKNQL